jgi:4-phosphopantoate--beta-alanine ligase
MGKRVVAIDLNPLSRTAQLATITIVDNIVRAMPILVKIAKELRTKDRETLRRISSDFDNKSNLGQTIELINGRLSKLAEPGIYISLLEMNNI